MLAIVRNLGGGASCRLAAPFLTRLGAQPAAACSSRSWIVKDNTPFFVTSTKPLKERRVVVPGPVSEGAEDQATAKPALVLRFKLKDGREAVVRRAEPCDKEALGAFMKASGAGAGLPACRRHLCETAVEEHLWMAQAPGHDALVAVVDGRIVGTASIDPETHELAPAKNDYFLRSHGMAPADVCVGHLTVLDDVRCQGVGTALKRAEALAAARAGYQGVTSEAHGPTLKAIVKKLGGTVDEGSVLGWTLVRADAKGVTSE